MLLHAITSTIVYFQQADITGHQFHDRALRTAFFAQLDLTVNTLTNHRASCFSPAAS